MKLQRGKLCYTLKTFVNRMIHVSMLNKYYMALISVSMKVNLSASWVRQEQGKRRYLMYLQQLTARLKVRSL